MMPPLNPLPAPTGDLSPDPNSILELGGGRWLSDTGVVIYEDRGFVVGLTAQTRKYWEAAAVRAGHKLDDLIV
jgi:hypothetical protein